MYFSGLQRSIHVYLGGQRARGNARSVHLWWQLRTQVSLQPRPATYFVPCLVPPDYLQSIPHLPHIFDDSSFESATW